MTETSHIVNCRRKANPWINLRHLGFNGRRTNDTSNAYVDYYDSRLFAVVMIIITCSCLDAVITLELLSRGAIELNTLMARLIETDVQQFINVKIALTGLSLVFLVVHKNFRLWGSFTVTHLIYGICIGYSVLVTYELRLLAHYLP